MKKKKDFSVLPNKSKFFKFTNYAQIAMMTMNTVMMRMTDSGKRYVVLAPEKIA